MKVWVVTGYKFGEEDKVHGVFSTYTQALYYGAENLFSTDITACQIDVPFVSYEEKQLKEQDERSI